MSIKKEQQNILKKTIRLFSIMGMAFICSMISMAYKFEMGFWLSIFVLVGTLIYVIKIRKERLDNEKALRRSYPDVFYNVQEPSHFEISSYLTSNGFCLIEKEDMIFAAKYYKTKSRLWTEHNILSMTFLFENDNQKENKPWIFKGKPSSIEVKYSHEMNEFMKAFNQNLNIKNKYVSSVFMRLTMIGKPITEITKDDITHWSLVYNKDENTLYYPSYIKDCNFIPTTVPYVEIDKCLSTLFDLN